MIPETRLRRTATAILLACATALPSRRSAAQPTHDPVAAEGLYKTAIELLGQGDWGAACTKFQASEDLDPAVSTLIKLAKCREHEGKLAEAWYTLRQALKLNRELTTQTPRRREELESFARAEFAALEPRVPRLRIQVPSAPSGLTLMRDGKAIPTSALGEALAVDPGEHELIAAAPGFRGEKRRVSVQEGETIEVAFQLVAELPTAIAPRRARPDAQLAADADGDASSSSQRRTAGFIVGGVGAAGILAGGVLGGFTLARAGGAAADESGNADRAAARSTQTAAFVAAGIGAAALATGVVLVITAGSSETSPPAVTATVGPARASLRAVW